MEKRVIYGLTDVKHMDKARRINLCEMQLCAVCLNVTPVDMTYIGACNVPITSRD